MIFIEYPKCSTCKKAKGSMTEEEKIALLASDGMLVKRPLVVTEDKVLVGFKEKEWEALL